MNKTKEGKRKARSRLFRRIAWGYGLFFQWQKKSFMRDLQFLEEKGALFPGARVLDLGCGTGALAAALLEKGCQVVGVDPVEEMLQVARKKAGKEAIFLRGYGEELVLPDHSFDLVLATHVAHGLPGKERRSLYRRMQQLSKGYVALLDFHGQRGNLLLRLAETVEDSYYEEFLAVGKEEFLEALPGGEILPLGETSAWFLASWK